MGGAEFAGEVLEIGKEVRGFKVGDRVVPKPYNLFCGKCFYCTIGRPNLCSNSGRGTSHGGFTEYSAIAVPNHPIVSLKVADHVSDEEASVVEPLACALHAIDRAQIRFGDSVAVLGQGSIGQLVLQGVKWAGAGKVFVTDTNGAKLEVSRKMGADEAIDASRVRPAERIAELTEGRGADVVFEMVGSPDTFKETLDVVRKGGRVVAFGVVNQPVDGFDTGKAFGKEIDMVWCAGEIVYRTFVNAYRCIETGRINVRDLITHTFPLEEAIRAFEVADRGENGAIKVVVKP